MPPEDDEKIVQLRQIGDLSVNGIRIALQCPSPVHRAADTQAPVQLIGDGRAWPRAAWSMLAARMVTRQQRSCLRWTPPARPSGHVRPDAAAALEGACLTLSVLQGWRVGLGATCESRCAHVPPW
jgi:hypothetical protein